jgi:hypothetical protein
VLADELHIVMSVENFGKSNNFHSLVEVLTLLEEESLVELL